MEFLGKRRGGRSPPLSPQPRGKRKSGERERREALDGFAKRGSQDLPLRVSVNTGKKRASHKAEKGAEELPFSLKTTPVSQGERLQ